MIDIILLLGGKGTRLSSDTRKQFIKVSGKELFLYSFETFLSVKEIDRIILVTNKGMIDVVSSIIAKYKTNKKIYIVESGETRQLSVFNGLIALKNLGNSSIVLIHDSVRPLIDKDVILRNIESIKTNIACTTYSLLSDTIAKISTDSILTKYENRDELIKIETPQSFKFDIILNAHLSAFNLKKYNASDDIQLLSDLDKVELILNIKQNIKITTEDDLKLFEKILKND